MIQIALLVLTPLLALVVADRRIVLGVLVAAWGLLLIPQTQAVLLDEQLANRSMGNTAAYLILNELTLVVAVFVAIWIHRRRHSTAVAPAGA